MNLDKVLKDRDVSQVFKGFKYAILHQKTWEKYLFTGAKITS
jgi:hypothetical protein